MAALTEAQQRRVVRVVGLVQFVAIIDFMMILPLGPDLTAPLGIEASDLGRIVAAYTVSAAVAGIVGALFLDRVGRRLGLVVGLVGLSISTLAAAAAVDLGTLGMARAAAGAFGGPVTALGLSVVTDAIPTSRRGRAIGAVMGANALGAILGVPIGLWLAEVWRWEGPFVAVGIAGLAVAALVALALPPMRGHLAESRPAEGLGALRELAARPLARQALGMVFLIMVASFLLTPNLSAYVQYNLGFPRSEIPQLYFIAGAVSFVTMRLVGWVVDRRGAFVVGAMAALGFVAVVVVYLMSEEPVLSVGVGFVVLLVSLSSRNVAVRTLTTQVPKAHERARYLSLQSSVRYLAAAVGSLASSQVLETRADGALEGMMGLGGLVIALSLGALPLLWQVERRVRAQSSL